MGYQFPYIEPPPSVSATDWADWRWQARNTLKSKQDFSAWFQLSESEQQGFQGLGEIFQVRTTPYYAALALAGGFGEDDPIRRILMPHGDELVPGLQQMQDPLGEKRNSPVPRIVHRYTDRVLFLVTDTCSVYCRFCTRKHFTGGNAAMIPQAQYAAALEYIRSHKGVKEVILSGGDALTLSDAIIERIMTDLRAIPHVDIIRLGSRMPTVAPMRITENLVKILRRHAPVFFMSHFSHPREITQQAAQALTRLVDGGIPVLNQFVLLNGINNHPHIVRALSRRLLYLRVKPYYMFQCDPSLGTDHLRTSVEDSLQIQRELWGHLSGIAMPQLSLDIPDGGGKVALVPDFMTSHEGLVRHYKGWDGVEADYVSPPATKIVKPPDVDLW